MSSSVAQVVPAKPAKKKDQVNLKLAKTALEERQSAFNDVTKEPNTLSRNLVLAEHRTEIERLQKLIAKSTAS